MDVQSNTLASTFLFVKVGKIKWAMGSIILMAAILLGLKFLRITPHRISPQKYNQIFDEIVSVEFVFRAPTPDHCGSTLAYIHGASHGPGLYLLNLKTLERTLLPVTNEVNKINGWSPDDRYLIFVQVPPHPPIEASFYKEQWLTIYDRRDNSIRRLTDNKEMMEIHFFWLTTNTYLMAGRPLKGNAGEIFLGKWNEGTRKRLTNYMSDLVILSDKMAACFYKDNIHTLAFGLGDKEETTVAQLTHFKSNSFSRFQWPRYSQETSNYLFCAYPENSNWRYLFQFDPRTEQAIQLTTEDTYNGQFIQQGKGFAYVCNTNNSFYLAVRPKEPEGNTNLAVYGSVVNYTVAPDGNRIYITAAQGMEPPGIWEYDITARKLRLVADPLSKSFIAAKLVEPDKLKVDSFDGLEIPYFLFPPTEIARKGTTKKTDGFVSRLVRTKYPAVIFIPPPTWQVQKQFDAQSQFLANIGLYFVAVNYRGCDGYGKAYAGYADISKAAEDILTVHQEILKNSNIDQDNIFLLSSSAGREIVFELLATSPELWRGVALDKPVNCPIDERHVPSKLPPFALITGDKEKGFSALQKFVSWAATNKVELKLLIHTNSGHITYKLSERKNTLNHIASFYLDHLQ